MLPAIGGEVVGRMRPGDKLIGQVEVRAKAGGIAVSTLYDDPDLMALKVTVTAGADSEHSRAARWIDREVDEVIARRVARSTEKAAEVRARIERRHERRRQRQRLKKAGARPNHR